MRPQRYEAKFRILNKNPEPVTRVTAMIKETQIVKNCSSSSHDSGNLELLMRLIEKCVSEGRENEAKRIFDSAGNISFVSGNEALGWGMIAEMLGKTSTACRVYKNAIEDSGTAPEAFMRLGQICLERGDTEKAESFFKEAGRRGLPPVMQHEIMLDKQSAVSAEPDFVPLPLRDIRIQQAADRFLQLFRGRQGLYARQWYDSSKNISGYAPIHSLFTHDVAVKHLSGAFTVGVYPLTEESTVFFSALDIDVRKSCLVLMKEDALFRKKVDSKIKELIKRIYEWSLSKELTVVFEDSGCKGVHAWYFFKKAVPAAFAMDILNTCVESLAEIPEEINMEVFPRQAVSGGKGYGNLIKLPLGIHRRSGRKSVFLDQYGNPADDQIKHLLNIRKNSTEVLDS